MIFLQSMCIYDFIARKMPSFSIIKFGNFFAAHDKWNLYGGKLNVKQFFNLYNK